MKKKMPNEVCEIETVPTEKMNFARRIQKRISSSQYSYLFYCFIIPVIITYLVYLAMEIHPFGDGSVLVLDLNAQYVYFFEALRDFVHGDGNLIYSFSRALGGEFVGIYAYYIASPLSYIVALFPKDRMLEALLTLFLLKSGLCGMTFGFYLHKNSKVRNKLMILIFSSMYALSAFAVVQQNNTMWIDALIWLPLLTYGIEQLVKFGKYKLFVISLALTIFSNYYIGYMVCIYTAAYFLYYLLAHKGKENNPRGESAHFLRSFIRIAIFSVIGVAIAAFLILGAYYSLTFGKNTFTNPDFTPKAKFEIFDFLTKFLPGAYDTVRPEGLPFVYCGLLTVILVPIFFLSKRFSSREKVASICFIGFFVISFGVTTLDLIWHGFQNPNWLNHRYSFMLCFFLLVLAYKGMSALRSVSEKFILGICSFIILFVAIAEKQELDTYLVSDKKALLTFECVWLSIIAAVAFLVLLCLLKKTNHPKKRESITSVLALIVCIELFCSSLTAFVQLDGDVVFSDYSPYNSYLNNTRQIVDKVNENDPSFYRLELTEHRQINDNFALNANGLSGSTSTLNKDTVAFLKNMGYASESHWSSYKGGNPVNDSLLGIKYVVDSRTSQSSPLYYTQYEISPKYIAYRNPYALSLAYGVDSSVKDFDMTAYDSHFHRLNALVGSMLGEDEPAEIFVPVDMDDLNYENCTRSITHGHSYYSKNSDAVPAITMTATTVKDGELFFYAPSDYPRITKLTVNGTSKGTYFDGESNRIFSLGVYKAGETVTVKLTLDHDELYLMNDIDYFFHIDTEKLDECFTRLLDNPQFEINEDWKDTHLEGTVTTKSANQMILTTIPYDEGWKIYVDGEIVETYETLDALVAFDISNAGEHTLEMKYAPTAHILGAAISITALCAFIAICIIDAVLKRTLFKNRAAKQYDDSLWALDDFEEDERMLAELPMTAQKKTNVLKKLINIFDKQTIRNDDDDDSSDGTTEAKDENTKTDDTDGGN